MKKYISSLLVIVSGFSFAQTILNASSPEEFRQMRSEMKEKVGDTVISTKVKPLSYGFVDEKDILKSMFVNNPPCVYAPLVVSKTLHT